MSRVGTVVVICTVWLPRPLTADVTDATTVGPVPVGPSEMTSATALPGATSAAAAGFWLITLPAGTVALLALVIVPTTRLAFVMAVVAAGCVRPTTFGTETFAGPSETRSATGLPGATLAPASGF